MRNWAVRAEVDAGERPGLNTQESAEVRALKRRVAELERANEILKTASALFAQASSTADQVIVAYVDEHKHRLAEH